MTELLPAASTATRPNHTLNNMAFLPYFSIDNRAFLPYSTSSMKRRDALKIIRGAAQARGLSVTVDTKAGKGSHAKVTVGARRTTMPINVSGRS